MDSLQTNIKIESIDNFNSIVSQNEIIKTIESQEVVNLSIIGGDMNKSLYDTNYDGVIDTCHYIDCGTF